VGTEEERMTSAGTLYEKRLSASPAVVVSLTKIHLGEEDPDEVGDAVGPEEEEDDEEDDDVLEAEDPEERGEARVLLGATTGASVSLVYACGGGGTSSSITSTGRSKRAARSSAGRSRSVLRSKGERSGQWSKACLAAGV